MMNCTNIPTMTVCQTIFLWFRELSQRKKTKTARPNKLTARFSRVLSADSSETKDPTRITPIVNSAAPGTRNLSGMSLTNG